MITRLRRDWTPVFTAVSVADTVTFLQSGTEVDLIFLDIELSDGKSFDVFEQVNTVVPIIFTTAYDNHAIQAFKVNGVDYLLKPIDEQELAHALDKYDHLHQHKPVSANITPTVEHTDRVLTVSGDKYDYINISDINYLISEDHCVFAILNNGTRRMISMSNLSEIEEVLPTKMFFRISRNIIASIGSIIRVRKYFKSRLIINIGHPDNEQEICISAQRRDSFLSWLGK